MFVLECGEIMKEFHPQNNSKHFDNDDATKRCNVKNIKYDWLKLWETISICKSVKIGNFVKQMTFRITFSFGGNFSA